MTPDTLDRFTDPIVIVATGGISPTGRNPAEAHQAAMDFRSGIRELSPADILHFDTLAQAKGLKTDAEKAEFFKNVWGSKCGVGGVIPAEYMPAQDSNFYPPDFFKRGEQLVGTQVLLAYTAFQQVRGKLPQLFSEPGMRMRPDIAPKTMIDVSNGAGSSMEMVERELAELLTAPNDPKLGWQYGKSKWLLGMLGNMSAGQLAAASGIAGAQNSSNSACSSSGLSIYNAWNAIQAGSANVAVVGGSECPVSALATYVSFDHMLKKHGGALARNWRGNRPPEEALVAYGAERGGFVPGNAGALIVMMRQRLADTLKIEPLARVLGVVANTCQPDLYDKSLANGTISGQAALIRRLLEYSGIDLASHAGRIAHVMHATGTTAGGENEMYSAAVALGAFAREGRYAITGVKEREGHALGTAPAANVVAAVEAMRNGVVPGLPHTRAVDPKLFEVDPKVIGKETISVEPQDLRAVAGSVLTRKHAPFNSAEDLVLSTSMGFGGTNVGVALKSL